MSKLWSGRFSKETAKLTDEINYSINTDKRMYAEDIAGSIAHAKMLGATGILDEHQAYEIQFALMNLPTDYEGLELPPEAEDIHMAVEALLTRCIGENGKRLHTARSRNDQVALDFRMYIKGQIDALTELIKELLAVLSTKAREHLNSVMPAYTHLQRAQPSTYAHYLMAYANGFLRDISRLADCKARMNECPLGAGALCGTTYPIDREMTARELRFDKPTDNSLDSVSDRDFALEFLSGLAILQTRLSRFAEEVCLWCSWEFKFLELDDAFATGSSMMPQKKNPDVAELVRGKTGRVFGDLTTLLTVLKGLPLAYNKDMQEDKEAVFDALDTVTLCLRAFTAMLATSTFSCENALNAAGKGFINATDLADYLVNKGTAFRDAHETAGRIVAHCAELGKTLEELTLEEYKTFGDFDDSVYDTISLAACVARRNVIGGPAPNEVLRQIELIEKALGE
ncbi:MAG: argininosuccinate lyase [Oscillospiraceae bacterium]|jgi:argininosuccinate lyase|nr:argininosuccinate lyase [Oscillospiraceae bacterium]